MIILRTLSIGVGLAWGLLLSVSGSQAAAPECVRVYYDADPAGKDVSGRFYALYLQNLLGHFPQFQQIVEPIKNYRRGQVDECRATFYISAAPEAPVPFEFLEDYVSASKPVAWIGNTIKKLGPSRISEVFGYRYDGQVGVDDKHKDAKGRPTFFKNVLYKGEIFPKYGELEKKGFFGKSFAGDFAIPILTPIVNRATVMAEIEHNYTRQRLPYILRQGNRFYVADLPFSYIHEADRHLVFADLLFDVLGVEPTHQGKHYAIFRVEDVHACLPIEPLLELGKVSVDLRAPMHLAFIPIFSDPHRKSGYCDGIKQQRITLGERRDFVQGLRSLVSNGTRIIWHGVTHQSDSKKNPSSGASGDDFEFWDYEEKKPMPQDSASWVVDRLEQGWKAFTDAGFAPQIWEVPHYIASPLDYRIFSRLFSWNIGRITYYPHEVMNLPAQSSSLWFERSGPGASISRRSALSAVQVRVPEGMPETTLFPYEIYGDYYGMRVLPESLGYVTSLGGADSAKGSKTHEESRSIDDLLSCARRNRVLRDSWASFFFHPYLLEGGKSAEPVRRLISTIQSYGYEFVDLETFIRDRKSTMRPEAIERR